MGKFNAATFVTTYLPIPVFLILFFGYKFVHKTEFVKSRDMDFVTGSSAELPIDVSCQ